MGLCFHANCVDTTDLAEPVEVGNLLLRRTLVLSGKPTMIASPVVILNVVVVGRLINIGRQDVFVFSV